VRNNGYVLFERVLSEALVRDMNATFFQLMDTHRSTVEANRGANRWQMHLPFGRPFSDERVVACAFVLPIVEALVGEDCICQYFASDTPLPGSNCQEVHPDVFPLFPESDRVLPPAGSRLIRDSRMWHRGTPNRSNAPQRNMTLIYSRYWLRLRYRPIPIAQQAYERLCAPRGRPRPSHSHGRYVPEGWARRSGMQARGCSSGSAMSSVWKT
jgi:hypothetical protein